MVRFCFKDKTRECDESCAAFHWGAVSSILYGLNAQGKLLTGPCLVLGAQWAVSVALERLRDKPKKQTKKKK